MKGGSSTQTLQSKLNTLCHLGIILTRVTRVDVQPNIHPWPRAVQTSVAFRKCVFHPYPTPKLELLIKQKDSIINMGA